MSDKYHETRVIERVCHCCIVRLSIWRPEPSVGEDGWVDIELISNSSTAWHGMWRNRIRNAWAVLRGRYNWSGFDLFSPDEARSFRDTVCEAVDEAFPSITSEMSVTRGKSP